MAADDPGSAPHAASTRLWVVAAASVALVLVVVAIAVVTGEDRWLIATSLPASAGIAAVMFAASLRRVEVAVAHVRALHPSAEVLPCTTPDERPQMLRLRHAGFDADLTSCSALVVDDVGVEVWSLARTPRRLLGVPWSAVAAIRRGVDGVESQHPWALVRLALRGPTGDADLDLHLNGTAGWRLIAVESDPAKVRRAIDRLVTLRLAHRG